MNARHPTMPARLRGAWRMARVALHLAWALLLAAGVYPVLGRAARQSIKRRWSRHLVAMLGVRLHAAGAAPQIGELVVANHVSWLDIYVINAICPCAFVAKDDVRHWPLIGWLSARADTLFLDRRSARAAHAARADIAAALAGGLTVAVFPEGTTSDGRRVLPFHGALLQGALDAAAAVRPLALRYTDAAGRPTLTPAYCGDTTLLESLWRIACAPGLHVDVAVLPQLRGNAADRRRVAAVARGMIVVAIEHGWHAVRRPRPGPAPTDATAAEMPCLFTSSSG